MSEQAPNQPSNSLLQGGSRADVLLAIADDELILGWRNSEWTGIARALYQLMAEELGTTADELAFDRKPEEYRCSPFVERRLVPDWARSIARQVLYEQADEERIKELMDSDDADVAGLAAKIDREEAYHRMHAQMWHERLQDEPRYVEALDELRPLVDQRGEHLPEFEQLWEEMTEVRRSVAGATW